MSHEAIDLVKAARKAAIERVQAVADVAAAEGRQFTAEEQTRYDSAMAEFELFDARLRELQDDEARARRVEKALKPFASAGTPARGDGTDTRDSKLEDQFREAVLEGNPAPIDVRGEGFPSVTNGVELRTLSKGTANLYPVSFYSQLVEHLVETAAVLRAGATLVTTTSGEDLRVPKSTALSSGAIVAEAATIPTSDPGLGVVTLGAFKYGILIQVSSELAEDVGFDLSGYLARETGIALGNALGNHLINGTGTGQPRGVLADSTAGVTGPTGTATSLGAQGTASQGTDILVDLYHSLAEPYSRQPSTAWLTRNASLGIARRLKGTTGDPVVGDFVGSPPPGSDAQAGILNAPVYVDPFVPAMAANAKSILFGDWSKYFVRIVNGVRFERSNDFAFSTDLVTFRALLRADGALVDTTGAIKHFANSAT